MSSDPTVLHKARRWLNNWSTITLATISPEGLPHAANVQIAVINAEDELGLQTQPSLSFVFVSKDQTAHAQHISSQPQIACAAYGHQDAPSDIHGLQIRGTCHVIDQPQQLTLAQQTYTKRYPFVASEHFQTVIRESNFYWVQCQWIRLIDNRQSFGFKSHWEN